MPSEKCAVQKSAVLKKVQFKRKCGKKKCSFQQMWNSKMCTSSIGEKVHGPRGGQEGALKLVQTLCAEIG
jgi:hypothetical protein